MDTASLDYQLPESAVAQVPVEPRDSARLLVSGPGSVLEHRVVAELDQLLDPGDVVVVNDTKVIPARLRLRKETGGAVEVLLLVHRGGGEWEALVRPSRRVAPGSRLVLDGGGPPDGPEVAFVVGDVVGAEGTRLVSVTAGTGSGPGHEARTGGLGDPLGGPAPDWLERAGEVPLPPYIHEPLHDVSRYQTVFATRPGSVAAPTAGLHLTDALLDRCRARGVTIARVELVVGLGTFRPITTERVEDHPMHAERYRIPEDTAELLSDRIGSDGDDRRRRGSGRVVAVGTTAVRALESWAATGCLTGDTRLFIHGRYPFAVVDRLLTNFHVPRSSLLALVESFAGPGWRELYAEALRSGYRFLSFGDAMLLDRDALQEVPRP